MSRGKVPRRRGLALTHVHSEFTLNESKASDDSLRRLQGISKENGFKNCHKNPHVCGKEAACRTSASGTSKCVCPHDLSPPTKNLKCPNRLLVPVTPRPIYNIIPPTINATNGTTVFPDTEKVTEESHENISEIVGITVGCITLLALIGALIYFQRRKSHSMKNQRPAYNDALPMNLKEGLLLANKYKPNPQYFTCPPPEVSLFMRENFIFHHDIGEGCFGKVFKGELNHDETNEIVAVKVLKDSASRDAEEDFMREVEIMSTFRHENILTLLGVVLRDSENGPWMVFEYMPYGDLAGVLRANTRQLRTPTPGLQPLTKSSLHRITIQIAAGMTYLSIQRFVHRDLACRNCLVGTDLIVKIADFGMSRDVYTCDYYKIGGSRLLPVRWMAPESVMYGRFTLESDVWSFGVVLWEVYSYGKQPYYGYNNEEVVRLILQGVMLVPPKDCPSFISKIMHECWKSEPRDRLRFSQIYERLENPQENKLIVSSKGTLPRPPRGPVSIRSPTALDSEGYLLPAPTVPSEYLQTLEDLNIQ